MPSAFETAVRANLDPLYAEFGLATTYTAPDGTTTACTIRLHRNEAHQVDRTVRVNGEMQTGEIMVRQTELAKPVRGGRFVVEGVEAWTIELTPVLKNGQHQCTVSRAGVERMTERTSRQ